MGSRLTTEEVIKRAKDKERAHLCARVGAVLTHAVAEATAAATLCEAAGFTAHAAACLHAANKLAEVRKELAP